MERTKKLRKEIQNINRKIDRFQTRVELAPQQAKDEVQKTLYDIRLKREELKNKFNTIVHASEDALTDLQVGAEMAIKDLEIAYESAKERFFKKVS